MGAIGIAGLVAGQLFLGVGLLCIGRSRVLRAMWPVEKLCVAMLLGITAYSFTALALLLAGGRISDWWWLSLLGCGGVLIGMLRVSALKGSDDVVSRPVGPHFLKWPLTLAAVGLLSWVVVAAVFLPTTDYDGIAIWSYRVRVLLREHTIYTDSLRDPTRMIGQPLHPYLIPVMETAYAAAWGKFSWAATHVPYILFYLAYLGLAVCASRMVQGARRSLALLASLVLMPAMATDFSMMSAREPIMAVYGFAAVYFLARWAERPYVESLLLGTFFAVAMQQCKIEGLPFAIGWVVGAALIALQSNGSRRARLVQLACASSLWLLAVPWVLVKVHIPKAHIDSFLGGYSGPALFRLEHVGRVVWLVIAELFFRPERYGFAAYVALAGLLIGWRRDNFRTRIALLAGPMLCLAAVTAIYSVRQEQLPAERNISISRRVMCVAPALVFAALYLPARRRTADQGSE